MMLRPMRPKPLIPTLMGILPPMGMRASGRATLRTSATLRNLKWYGLRQQKSTQVQDSDNFFAVHAHSGSPLLNRLLHLRRQSIDPLHRSGALLRKIQKGGKNLLQLLWRQVRHSFTELQENSASGSRL